MEPVYQYTGKFLTNWRLDEGISNDKQHVYTGDMVYVQNDKLLPFLSNRLIKVYHQHFYNLDIVQVYYDDLGGVTAWVRFKD